MVWKTALAIIVVLLIAAGGAAYWWQLQLSNGLLVLPGTVEVQEVRLSSKIGGRVKDVFVDDGANVKEGDRLVELDIPELKAQRQQVAAQLDAAKAAAARAERGPLEEEYEASQATLDAAKARLAKMDKGNRDKEIEQVEKNVDAWKVDLANARRDLQRISGLVQSKSATHKEFDDAEAKYRRLEATVNEANARLELMREGFRDEDKAEALAEFNRAKANDALLRTGTREEDKAAARARVDELAGKLAELDVNITEAVVKAPENAVVELVSVRKGDTTTPNQSVVRILRATDLWVKAFVPETELGRVRLNEPVEVTMDTYPDRKFQGRVTYVSSTAEFTPRNVQSVDERRHQVFAIKVRVEDPQGIFKSGMAADVHLPKEPKGERGASAP
ncbi:MAG: HlyD family secretion protein [Pirellulaceae bacterium]